MYEKIVDQNPYETPMMIYPAVHYTMGGVWVDYNLMTTIPGCFAIGEANFSIKSYMLKSHKFTNHNHI